MRSTKQLSVTLPHEMAARVRERVAAGEYASESEVIREGLRALQAREKALEAWLHGEAALAYDRFVADPDSALSVDDIRAALDEEHARTSDAN